MNGNPVMKGYTAKHKECHEGMWEGLPLIGNDSVIDKFQTDSVLLANGVGSLGLADDTRRRIYSEWSDKGYQFPVIVHPTAIVSPGSSLAEGVQVLVGSVVQTGARIEENSIINTKSIVEHHCRIGAHTHVAPGAVLCGNVQVGSGVHIGAGAIIKQGLHIGDQAVVGAGAVVIRDVPAHRTVIGVPAKEVR